VAILGIPVKLLAPVNQPPRLTCLVAVFVLLAFGDALYLRLMHAVNLALVMFLLGSDLMRGGRFRYSTKTLEQNHDFHAQIA
jgi:hypothetical protein